MGHHTLRKRRGPRDFKKPLKRHDLIGDRKRLHYQSASLPAIKRKVCVIPITNIPGRGQILSSSIPIGRILVDHPATSAGISSWESHRWLYTVELLLLPSSVRTKVEKVVLARCQITAENCTALSATHIQARAHSYSLATLDAGGS